jgi:hypothetical protein
MIIKYVIQLLVGVSNKNLLSPNLVKISYAQMEKYAIQKLFDAINKKMIENTKDSLKAATHL